MEDLEEYTARVNGIFPSCLVREPVSEVIASFSPQLETEMKNSEHLIQQVEEMMNQPFPVSADVIIIGGGPGGYVAAIRAAQLGGKVVLIEKNELGGVCLNRGCIPTKAMLSSANAYDLALRGGSEFGFTVDNVTLDYAKVLERRDKIVKQLVSGLHFLMKKYAIRLVKGTARIASRTTVEVAFEDGRKEKIAGQSIIIATGSEPVSLPIPGLQGENIWDSDGALAATEPPMSILIIGGGAIGLEWGYMFRKFGSEVTIVELMPQILPMGDSEVAGELRKSLEKAGIRILTDSRISQVEQRNNQVVASIVYQESQQQIAADKVLVAVGRRPVTDNLGLEQVGVVYDQKGIKVDEHMQTNIPRIYAIGDAVGGMLLAHKASEEGVVAAENIMGKPSKMKYNTLPSAVYTTPEVAGVGMTEDQAKRAEIDYRVGKFYFRANGKALGLGETTGFVKFITDPKYGEILGCHIIGPHATDLIHEVVIGMEAEATIDVIGRAIHAHPTLSEVVKEAALDADGESLHKG
ncbi:MAG: dihydrolipoyl dehydrogenase [Armatimonadota bacterium]|nr:dihydrolipoyl dehydrogenase [Armatimonadota bacterium]